MRKNIGIIALTIIAVLMSGGARASDGEIERMTLLMKGMSTATTEAEKDTEAKKDVDSLLYMAEKAPFDVKALADAFIRLKTAGFTGSDYLQALVDAVAHFNGNSGTLHQAAFAIQQMVTIRRVSIEELKQLDEAIPNASQLMARGLSLSMADMIDKVSKGQVKSKEALILMFRQFEITFAGDYFVRQ